MNYLFSPSAVDGVIEAPASASAQAPSPPLIPPSSPMSTQSRLSSLCVWCQSVAELSHDKAKEVADRERDVCRSSRPRWAILLSSLSQMAIAEKQYMAFAFLGPKGFLRKDNSLRNMYESLTIELSKLDTPSHGDHVAFIAGQIRSFAQARLKLMEFYAKVCAMGTNSRRMDYEALLEELNPILEFTSGILSCESLLPLRTALIQECETLKAFIGCLADLLHWRYYEAVIKMASGSDHLSVWSSSVQSAKEARKLGSFTGSLLSPFRTQQDPLLFQWLWRLKDAVVAKFTLYFYEALSQQAQMAMPEFKANCAKLSPDFAAKLQSFQKRYEAVTVTLLFDATAEADFRGPAFHLPQRQAHPPQGLDLLPVAFTASAQPLAKFLPSVAMIMTEYDQDLKNPDKIVHFFDHRSNFTYFLHRIESQMHLLVILESRRSDPDPSVLAFITETSEQLRGTALFASLKPGTR